MADVGEVAAVELPRLPADMNHLEALFRATSLVEQNLEILIPRPLAETSVYSAAGATQRGPGRMIAAS